MKIRFLILVGLSLICFHSFGQKKAIVSSVGVDYRQTPTDIENVPRGAYSSNGDFYGRKFWEVPSLYLKTGLQQNRNWLFSVSSYFRYNHMNWTSGHTTDTVYPYGQKERKNFKFDIIVDAEKKVRFKNSKGNLFFVGGIGVININTGYDITLQDSTLNGLGDPRHYKGTLMRLAPRISVGYQYKPVKFSVDCYLVEGPDLTGLASLWIGACLSYEFYLRKPGSK